MAKHFRSAAPLRRNGAKKIPKPKIVIVCEGKVTEPRYFTDLRRLCGNGLVSIETIGGCGVPLSVVERAVEKRDELSREARRTRDSFDSCFEVWAVFDRDEHPEGQVPAALNLAREKSVSVAYSSPCFEVWGLMHYSCRDRPGHHHEAQRDLKASLKGYCHTKNPVLDVTLLEPLYGAAVTNAQVALKRREAESRPNGDPSTSVHLLTERIRRFGKT